MVAAGRMRREAANHSWVHSTPADRGLVDGKSPGTLEALCRALAEVVEAGPVPAVDGVVC